MKTAIAVFVCLASASVLAQQSKAKSALSLMGPVHVQPRAQFVTSGEQSLKWIGQTVTEEDQTQQIVLQNVSERTITGFQLGWAIFIPEGCGVTEVGVSRGETHRALYEARTVAPGEKVTVGPYHLSTDSIVSMARHAHSPAVVAQIGIAEVRFDNGMRQVSAFEQLGAFGQEPADFACQNSDSTDPNLLTTLSADDGVFQFKYSQLLVNCMEGKHQAGWWADESCEAYIPVCDDPSVENVKTLACVAYPKYKFDDAPAFEAAAFSAARVSETIGEKECLDGSSNWSDDERKSRRSQSIGGTEFQVFDIGDAAMNQRREGTLYRTFHDHTCYQLALRVATADPSVFDGNINEFTKEDSNEVHSRLQQALDSFQFLK